MTFKEFIKEYTIDEDSLAFSYKDGDDEQTILITGKSKQIKKIKKSLPNSAKVVNNVPDGAVKMSASDWLSLQ